MSDARDEVGRLAELLNQPGDRCACPELRVAGDRRSGDQLRHRRAFGDGKLNDVTAPGARVQRGRIDPHEQRRPGELRLHEEAGGVVAECGLDEGDERAVDRLGQRSVDGRAHCGDLLSGVGRRHARVMPSGEAGIVHDRVGESRVGEASIGGRGSIDPGLRVESRLSILAPLRVLRWPRVEVGGVVARVHAAVEGGPTTTAAAAARGAPGFVAARGGTKNEREHRTAHADRLPPSFAGRQSV